MNNNETVIAALTDLRDMLAQHRAKLDELTPKECAEMFSSDVEHLTVVLRMMDTVS